MSNCSTNRQTANNYTYGEIGTYAIKSLADLSSPNGLADAKASIFAACTRNTAPKNCACPDQPGSSARPGDKAAWSNIANAAGGGDRSAGAAYFCVGSNSCGFVHTCSVPNTAITLQRSLAPVGTVFIGSSPVYFFSDPTKGFPYERAEARACSSISGPSSDWTYGCIGQSTQFARGSNVTALAHFKNLTVKHRFRAEVRCYGNLQFTTAMTDFNIVGSGWQQAYFRPVINNVQSGNWDVRIFLGTSDGAFRLEQTVLFSVP